jgi:ribosomal protein S18 acetylase RimI-like enzyme
MDIKNLKDTPFADIVAALSESFSDYLVPMPSEVSYWENRFKAARVDFGLSFGMFDKDKLVGFIINGIDDVDGIKTAFNTGTGVTQSARGQGVTDKLYQYALPIFKDQGIQRCSLEVIEKNERAIHVYERIGFAIHKRLKCFKGAISPTDENVTVTEVPFAAIEAQSRATDHFYSWDNTSTSIKASGSLYKSYKVMDSGGQESGYFVINPLSGYVAQLDAVTTSTDQALKVLSGMASVANVVKINNIDTSRTPIISALLKAGLDNFIDQYEMQLSIG